MPSKELKIKQIPSFVKTRTSEEMKKMALKLSQIKKVNDKIQEISDDLLLSKNEQDFVNKTTQIFNLTSLAEKTSNELIEITDKLEKKVKSYRKSL